MLPRDRPIAEISPSPLDLFPVLVFARLRQCHMKPLNSRAVRQSQRTPTEELELKRFKAIALPHLGAAYRLAGWLVHDEHDAEDVVQESFLSAFKYFAGFSGADGKAWLLTIVRNTAFAWLRDHKDRALSDCFDEEIHSLGAPSLESDPHDTSPESGLLRADAQRLICEALANLPLPFREIIVLRELEDLSYREIARVVGIPIGTVMSRLARGRDLMRKYLLRKYPEQTKLAKEGPHGL
jgi:RNA polymerase sigma factor (sigma-70 family)